LERGPRFDRHQPRELAHQLVRARVEPRRNLDANGCVKVAGRLARQPGQPLTPQPKHLAAGRSGRHDEHGLARGSWHPDAGPQERLPYADWDLAMHAVALAAKERVLSDPCADDQIATGSSEWTGIPFPGDANLRSGVDAGGHADEDRFDDAADTAAEARRASRPVAGAARATLRTGREPLHVQPDARPPNHPGERQLDDGMDIIAAPAFRLRLAVHDLRELVRRATQTILGALHALDILALQRFAGLGERVVDGLAIVLRKLGAVLTQRALGRIHERVGLVAHLDLLLALRVLGRIRLGLLHHPIDLVLGQAGRRGDGDVLLLAGRLVLRRDVQDAVRVDVEGHLDLRHLTRRRRDADQVE